MGSSHHGSGDFPDDPEGVMSEFRQKLMRHRHDELEAMANRGKAEQLTPVIELGAQHDFPEAKYGPQDEGSLALAVGHDIENRKVVIDYRTPVTWLAMGPEQAKHFAQLLLNHAQAVEGGSVGDAVREALGKSATVVIDDNGPRFVKP